MNPTTNQNNFFSDYLRYNEGWEVPESFSIWGAMSLLSTVVGRKAWVDLEYFKHYCNLYIVFVGTPGSGKSVAKDFVRAIITQNFPSIPQGADVQSREDIMKRMGEEDAVRAFKSVGGKMEYFRPYFLCIDELGNFLSVDAKKMIGTLVGAFSTTLLTSSYKNAGSDYIENPYITMLACVPPDWMMANMKIDLFSGGLGRRLIIVYDQNEKCMPWPKLPTDHGAILKRMLDHLKMVKDLHCVFTPDEEAREWYSTWYVEHKKTKHLQDNPIIRQFWETKQVMLWKVSMAVALGAYEFKPIIKRDHMQQAMALLDMLEPKVAKLTSGIGRNELAGIAAQMLETLTTVGGQMIEKRFRVSYFRHVRDHEYNEAIMHLKNAEEVFEIELDFEKSGSIKRYLVNKEMHAKLNAKMNQNEGEQK